jgi:protein SCO1/2
MKRAIIGLSIALMSIFVLRAILGLRTLPELPILGDIPEFELVDQRGERFGSRDLATHAWIATFIYTTCPGPCPRVVETIGNVDRRLSHDPRVRIVSFSVDPLADTPETLAVYARTRGIDSRRWALLTGDVDTLYGLVRTGFKLGVEQNEAEDVETLGPIVHSTHAVLVDDRLRVRGYYDTTDPEAMVRLAKDARRLADTAGS